MLIAENDRPFLKGEYPVDNQRSCGAAKVRAKLFFGSKILTSLLRQ